MIRAKDAIATARSLLGTPYASLDCINFIKKVIRIAPNGEPKYTTSGTDALWSSADMSPKYRDLIWRQEGLAGARPGMIAFKGSPTEAKDGEPHHCGLVAEKNGQLVVIHSSSSKGMVVETPLTEREGWSLLAIHRYIEVEKEEQGMSSEILYEAVVSTPNGGKLNLRTGPGTGYPSIALIPNGETIEVLDEYEIGWLQINWGKRTGFVSREFVSAKSKPEERWGIWVPCESEEQADALASLFSNATVGTLEVEESID